MIWYVIIGMFGAFGLLCALWIFLGSWLTQLPGGTVVLWLSQEQIAPAVRRYRWLRALSLVRARLVIVTAAPPQEPPPDVEFLTLEQYLPQLEQEQKEANGT